MTRPEELVEKWKNARTETETFCVGGRMADYLEELGETTVPIFSYETTEYTAASGVKMVCLPPIPLENYEALRALFGA